MKKNILLCCVLILSISVLCGFSEDDAEKLVPVSFVTGVEGENTLVEELEIELSEEVPEIYYSGESNDGDIFLVFEDVQSEEDMRPGAISIDVTIFSNEETTYKCGFSGSDAVVKVLMEPNTEYEIVLRRGVKDDLDGGEEMVETSFGKVKIYAI